jgi:hypothetical protein
VLIQSPTDSGPPSARSKRKAHPNKPPKEQKPVNPDHKPFIDWFTHAFEVRYGFKYAFQGGYDAKRVETILKRTNLITAQNAIAAALADDWWGPKGVDLKTSLENLPKFQGLASTALFGAPRKLSETEKATQQVLAAVREQERAG